MGSEQLDPGGPAWGSAPGAHSHKKATFLPRKFLSYKLEYLLNMLVCTTYTTVVTQVFQLTSPKLVNKQGYCETDYVFINKWTNMTCEYS